MVELAPVARDLDVPRAVAAALSVQEVAGQSLTELLVARLSRRRSLLGLDNCEHLLEGCRELIEALLQGCPELRVVATSREPLGLASEHLWQLAPLAVPAPEQETSLKSLTDYAAVQLFLERAAAVQPGFALNAYVAPAVVEICRRLDGIPLAIELAAARVDSLTPREIASRLDERFTLLSKRGPGPLAHHHQTLQAALDWSHELLSGPEQVLLRRLSVFAGSFDIEAAEAVCPGGELGAHEVGGLLGELVSKSLVVARSGSLPMERYRLLETIRAYAGEKLTQVEEATALRTAHVRHYLQLAERAEPELTGSDQAAWFERLETERGNLRAAIEWSLSQGEADRPLRLAGALVLYWCVRCRFSEGRELLSACVAAGDGADPRLQAKVLWGAGFLTLMNGDDAAAIDRGDLPPARTRFEHCLAVSRASGDTQGLRLGLMGLGWVAVVQGDYDSADSLLHEAVAVTGKLGDNLGTALVVVGLCELALGRGDYSGARELVDSAVQHAGLAGSPPDSLAVLLARVAYAEGDRSRAQELYEKAIALSHRSVGGTWALNGLGELLVQAGELFRARRLLEEALELASDDGARAQTLHTLGQLARTEGDLKRAGVLFDEALRLEHEAGRSPRAVGLLEAIAGLAAEGGRLQHAARVLGAAQSIRQAQGFARSPAVQWRYKTDLRLITDGLSPQKLSEAFRHGEGLSMAQAIALVAKAPPGHRQPATGWASLTQREAEIAALVGTGLNNREIAERLLISRATVKRHLTSVFEKLGLTARTDLAREVRRRGVESLSALP
ncbi:MAG: LuxR C-terminal-related transcriptional regulator [Actinobacteria bacterium]|nr:LuxR C-terminal-related transcriptional regulator [Actinomycetota bacterium]